MKKRPIALLSVSIILLAGCSKVIENGVLAPGKGIQIVPTIGATTKAPVLDEDGSGGFIDGDRFTILTSLGNQTVKTSEYTVGKDWLTWNELGYPTGTKVSFAACYPVVEMTSDWTCTFDCQTAQYKDLLLAASSEVDSYSTSPVLLNFKHALHILEINFSADAEDYTEEELKNLTLTCTARKSCTVDIKRGVLGETGSETATFHSVGTKAVFILPPQPTADVIIEFSLGEFMTNMTLAELLDKFEEPQTALRSGSRIKLDIKIRREEDTSKLPIEMGNATIGPWEDQAIVNGTINITTPGNGGIQMLIKPLTAWETPISFNGSSTVLGIPGSETLFETNPEVYYEYTLLTDNQKALYRQLRTESSAFDDKDSPLPRVSFLLGGSYSQNDINAVSSAFSKDQASFFHYSRLSGPVGSTATASFGTPYSTFAYRYRLFTEGADEILTRMPAGMNEFDKAKWLWDEFLKSVSYGQKEGSEGTVYGAFVLHRIVCEGYARGYQYLCQRAGIQALYIEGRAQNPSGGSEAHAWNVIRIDGNYYLADPTWDDGMTAGSDAVFYKLFLKGASHPGFANRTLTSGYEYPALSTSDYPHGL